MAFTLRGAHCSVLVAPDFDCPFVIRMYASDTGIGAVLSQVVIVEEHPIMYVSRKLLKHEKNYAVVERECLAIKGRGTSYGTICLSDISPW